VVVLIVTAPDALSHCVFCIETLCFTQMRAPSSLQPLSFGLWLSTRLWCVMAVSSNVPIIFGTFSFTLFELLETLQPLNELQRVIVAEG
jgi:hypothetical protein